jgi:hypothetical protein
MSPTTLPFKSLHDRVVESLRRHWVPLREAPEGAEPVPRSQLEDVSGAALDCLLTRQFRVGPLPSPEVYAAILKRVQRRVRRNQPIRVAIGYGPMKNPNTTPHSRADWAEFFALCHLAAWHNKVQRIYPPGLEIRVVFDDSTLAIANHADWNAMKSYMTSVNELIRLLGYDRLFLPSFRQSRLAWVMRLGFYYFARRRVRRWEQDPSNQEQIGRMLEFARRNVGLPQGLTEAERERYLRDASHRYRVYWEALQMTGMTASKRRIVAMYLDGSQHHLRQSIALHLTSLDKGQVAQPWQGEGALLDNGHGKLEPVVLTAGRLARLQLETVGGLDLIADPGFRHIAVGLPAVGKETATEAGNGSSSANYNGRLPTAQIQPFFGSSDTTVSE